MDLDIRSATVEDLPSLQAVFRRSSLSNEGGRAALLAHPESLIYAGSLLAERQCRVATVISGLVVGFAAASSDEIVFELEDLFVDPDWMRRGVGKALVADLLRQARSAGSSRIEVNGNPHARSFYESAGFVTDRTVQTEFGTGFRMHLDVPGRQQGSRRIPPV